MDTPPKLKPWFLRVWIVVPGALVASLLAFGVYSFQKVRRHSLETVVMSNLSGLEGAADQFFLENPYRLFVHYDELFGSTRDVRFAPTSVFGEDYHGLFPMRRDQTDAQEITLPNGGKVHWARTPASAADGVQVSKLEDGSRFETTWRHGVPDGPFQIYRPSGAKWSEGAYVNGRVVGSAWNYPGDGSRFDELDSAQIPANVARRKLAARDFAGAKSEFTRALLCDPDDLRLLIGRAEAETGAGDYASARSDLLQARDGFRQRKSPDDVSETTQRIALLERAQVQAANPGSSLSSRPVSRAAAGAKGAAKVDDPSAREWLLDQARQKAKRQDYVGAIGDYTDALAIRADAAAYRGLIEVRRASGDLRGVVNDYGELIELDHYAMNYTGRAEARRALGDLPGAIADYTAAVTRDPKYWEARYHRGYLLRLQHDLTGAAQDFRAVADSCLNDAHFHYLALNAALWLYFTNGEAGHADQAKEELTRTVATDKQPVPARTLSAIADITQRLEIDLALGRTDKATVLAQLKELDPTGKRPDMLLSALVFSALTQRQNGDAGGAREGFRQALAVSLPRASMMDFESTEARAALSAEAKP